MCARVCGCVSLFLVFVWWVQMSVLANICISASVFESLRTVCNACVLLDPCSCLSAPVCMCGEGRYLCEDSNLCLDRTKVCDGSEDCPNGDDETYCREFIFCFVVCTQISTPIRLNYRRSVHPALVGLTVLAVFVQPAYCFLIWGVCNGQQNQTKRFGYQSLPSVHCFGYLPFRNTFKSK